MHVQNVILPREKNINGDRKELKIENELFYNPVEVDYNEIFYRNEYGGIDSEDEKGRKMIASLRLYRSLYNFAWMLEALCHTAEKLENKIKDENIPESKRKQYEEALNIINNYYRKVHILFKKSYKEK